MIKLRSLLISFFLVHSSVSLAQDDILDFLPAILVASQFNSCSDGIYSTCVNSIGCRAIDGLFEDNICMAKPLGRSLAEQFSGRWSVVTSFDNGDFYNYLSFDLRSLLKISGSNDYALRGGSYSSNEYGDTNPYPTVVSFDNRNQDWYILDYWGTDIGLVSSIEIAQTSENQFDGCEFLLNFPDLTYVDGVCNPVRLRRASARPSLLRVVTNIVDDLSIYLSSLFGLDQSDSRPSNIAEARPSVNRIPGLPRLVIQPHVPIDIISPTAGMFTNGVSIAVNGMVDVNINLGQVTINDQPTLINNGLFDTNIAVDDGFNIVTIVADYGRRSFEQTVSLTVDSESPLVVAAASTSSSEVVVQFSEAMSDDLVTDTANFNISRNDNDANLPVTFIEFTDDSHTAVRLSTGLQSNVQYTVQAINARDVAGNTISGPIPEVEVSLSSAIFTGTRPTGEEIIDTDDDGILDHIELTGYLVQVRRTDGTFEMIHVTSDPFSDDADNDGVSDAEERHAGTDPLNSDTDGDTLSDGDEWNRIYSNPTDQDTDRDGIQDGFEYLFFKTSPILADTDGDQIDDPTELAAGNRNPLIADLPAPDISIGNVNLQLDTRFTFTNEAGESDTQSKTVEATLTQSENDSFSTANESSTKNTLNFSESLSTTVAGEVEFGVPPTVKASASVTTTFGSEQGSENGSTNSFGEESSRGAEEAYHDSLTLDVARDTRETISREVLGALMKVDLKIANRGDIPFTVSNLELTAQTQDPRDRRRLIPVASLTPENGSLGSINIGVLGDTDRGPFLFSSESVFPQEIQELMKNPRGLLVQLANYDIVDEEGNNYAFSSQDVLDRTVGITFDLGDGRVESYRVATASEHDENTGQPIGISMARALEIIGLNRYATIRDGGNGIAESTVGGDDVQLIFPGNSIISKAAVISTGPDGLIDPATIVSGDDVLVSADYVTEPFAASERIIDGGNGVVETGPSGADDYAVEALNAMVTPGSLIVGAGGDGLIQSVPLGDDILLPAGVESDVLVRFRDVEASEDDYSFWTLYTSNDLGGVDLDNFQLVSGQQIDFAFVKDQDLDGVWAREEYLHGSSDLRVNSDGCDLASPPEPCDTISDYDEIRTGWRVQLKSSTESYLVYPNPNQGDSDRDQLTDDVELACGLDPRQRDTDSDGLTDYEEIYGVRVNGINIGAMVSVNIDDSTITPFLITPYLGDLLQADVEDYAPLSPANFISHTLSAECLAAIDPAGYLVPGSVGFATDPLDEDTDGDFVNDLAELSLGLHPNDAADGASFLDDDGDGLPNALEADTTRTITVNGVVVPLLPTNANKIDSDDDKLPDLLEFYLGSNPNEADTDGDGILDTDEYRNGGDQCIGSPKTFCDKFLTIAAEDYNAFTAACEEAEVCDVSDIEGIVFGVGVGDENQLGTNLNYDDSDADGRTDLQETEIVTITVNNGPVTYESLPTVADSDGDGLFDGEEFDNDSNARNVNTDGDTWGDFVEVKTRGSDPAYIDKRITVELESFYGSIDGSRSVGVWAYNYGGTGSNDPFHCGVTLTTFYPPPAGQILVPAGTNLPAIAPTTGSADCLNGKNILRYINVRKDTVDRAYIGLTAETGGNRCDEKLIILDYYSTVEDIDTSVYGVSNPADPATDYIVRCGGNANFKTKLNVTYD